MKTLVLIPAFNEASGIATVIADIRLIVPNYDILVINDGSTDSTAAVASASGAVVVSHAFNMGYGVAIQSGYKYACSNDYDFIVQIDGDGQHDPSCIPVLLKPVIEGKVDFTLGSRFLGESNYRPHWARSLGMYLFNKLVSWQTRQQITDSTSGYQAFNRDVIRFFTSEAFPNDYPDADVLMTLHRAGFTITEIPVRMFSNTTGKSMHSGIKPLYYVFKMFLAISVILLRSRQHYRRW